MEVGEFVGMSVESKQPYFWSTIQVGNQKKGDYSIPTFASGIETETHFAKITNEVESIICTYFKRKISFVKLKCVFSTLQ
jgi:hypothetical protein